MWIISICIHVKGGRNAETKRLPHILIRSSTFILVHRPMRPPIKKKKPASVSTNLRKNIAPLEEFFHTVSTGLFISPSGISEIDCATTKTDTAERSISIGRESLQVFFFVLGDLAYFQVPPLGGSREEKWRSQ